MGRTTSKIKSQLLHLHKKITGVVLLLNKHMKMLEC